jgi:hypothetical protein
MKNDELSVKATTPHSRRSIRTLQSLEPHSGGRALSQVSFLGRKGYADYSEAEERAGQGRILAFSLGGARVSLRAFARQNAAKPLEYF